MAEQKFHSGDIIFREGEPGRTMYRIREGTVAVIARYGEPDEWKLTELGENAYLGEKALLEVYPHSATAVAASEQVTVDEISTEELRGYFSSHPDQLMGIMRHLSGRLRKMTAEYAEACELIRELSGSPEKKRKGLMARVKRIASVFRPSNGARKKTKNVSAEAKRDTKMGGEILPDTVTYRAGTVLFREGEQGHCMYDLRWGKVGIFLNYGAQNEKKIVELGPDTFFGEMGLIDAAPRSATAVILKNNTQLGVITEDNLTELFNQSPARILILLQQLSSRLRSLTDEYLNVCRLIARLNQNETEQASDEDREEAAQLAEYSQMDAALAVGQSWVNGHQPDENDSH